jgi:uncharacterized protein (TIGR00299 family) protein
VSDAGAAVGVAWFHCFAGIAGDMALGALIDAGADQREVRALLGRLDLPGWDLDFEEAQRGGVACTRAVVRVHEGGGVGRTASAIDALVLAAALPVRVETRVRAVFGALVAAEAALHRAPPEQVHLHEVGGHDALIDVVGTVAALEVLGVDEVCASAVAIGTGMVRSAHGPLPNPAPATVRLLEGIPAYGRDLPVELTTPTGAALLAALATSFGPLPELEVGASGFGGGQAELDDLPNCTQVVLGRRDPTPPAPGTGQPAVLLETNLDDVTGEQLGLALAGALEAGALDAWVSPVVMKKGRPGHVLHVLGDPARAGALRRLIERVTGTMGVRASTVERWPQARRNGQVLVEGKTVRIKATGRRAKAEFADVAALAAETGLSPHEVASRAEEEWRRIQRSPR